MRKRSLKGQALITAGSGALVRALGFGLSVEETQALLRQAGHSPLYPRLRRDAALIFCLGKGMSVLETQALLDKYGITLLGGVEKHDDE